MSDNAGRACPIRYRYTPEQIAKAEAIQTDCLYVVGGLYGNTHALAEIAWMAEVEKARLCFNGDFNWFNTDPATFEQINSTVLTHDAIAGNVEAELAEPLDSPDCGCAYPEHVDQGVVERSNQIHTRLKATARHFPALTDTLVNLPFFRRYRVGDALVGVVHGDAESLAGWRFDPSALENPDNRDWLLNVFNRSGVDVFASSHTCTAGFYSLQTQNAGTRLISNNGAAGMPSVPGKHHGLLTRIGRGQSIHPVCESLRMTGDVWVEQLLIDYTQSEWIAHFLKQWPKGSAAHTSYFQRIAQGTQPKSSA